MKTVRNGGTGARWLCGCLALAGALVAPGPGAGLQDPAAEPAPAAAPEEASAPGTVPTLLFRFESSFWLNLHHYLYREARERAAHSVEGAPAPAGSPDLPAEAAEALGAAVAYYGRELADKDLLFDDGMTAIKTELAAVGSEPSLAGAELPDGLAAALEGAAPAYRAHLWPGHDRANRDWIAAVQPLLAEHGQDLARELTTVLGSDWPQEPVRVDVVFYANWAGAYTTVFPTHVTISSTDPRHQGRNSLEVLFHEAAHGLISPVRLMLEEERQAQGKEIPRDLWHAVLFYTVGELVADRLDAGYIPYAERQGLYDRDAWREVRRVLEQDWQPYLDGKIDLASAIRGMVAAF